MSTIDVFDAEQSALILSIAATRRAASTHAGLAPVGPVPHRLGLPPIINAAFWVIGLLLVVAVLVTVLTPPAPRGRSNAPQCTVVITTGNAPLVRPGGPCDFQLPTI